MININQITAQLARMPDQALQQYAQMHKDDPYTLSLALAESNRRKQTRQGAQMGGQEQPKVVDQELQSMAAPMPEDVGIGQLPAGDMNFADGGIVAFSDGGDVPRFNGAAGSVPGSAWSAAQINKLYEVDPKLAEQARRGILTKEALMRAAPANVATAILGGGALASLDAASTLAQATPEQREQFYSSPMLGAQGGDAGLAAAILNAPGMEPPKSTSGAQIGKALLAIPRFLVSDPSLARERDAEQAKEAAATPSTQARLSAADLALRRQPAPAADSTAAPETGTRTSRTRVPPTGGPGAAPAAAAPGTATAAATAPGGLSDLQKKYDDILAAQNYKDPAAAQLEALKAKELAAAQGEKADIERDQARFAEAFKGREGRLTERASDIAKQKDTNTGLAFLNAGLAIMSTPGGLATALGKGAQVGTAQFAAGLDKIRSAQEKLDEARDRMEELKLNRAEMSAKEIRAADSRIRNIEVDAEKRAIDGIRQAGQVNRETAKEVFGKTVQLGITQLEVAGRQQVAETALKGQMAQASATRASATEYRMAGLAESVRKNIAAEALKKFPYDTAAQANYEQQMMQAAVKANPALAQYMGVSGGGGASAGGTDYSKWGNLSTGK